jgi:glucan 1,3-beta-glucosidase
MHPYSPFTVSVFVGLFSSAWAQSSSDPVATIPAGQSTALYPAYTYTPSVDAAFKPVLQGLSISHPNKTVNPLNPISGPVAQNSPPALPEFGPLQQPSTYWYQDIVHDGISPFIDNGSSWVVYRNVKDYGAKGDGVTDDAPAIQAAINFVGRGPAGNGFGTTGAPAVIYFPEGNYLLGETVQSWVDTFFIGNPINRPTLKASSTFNGSTFLEMTDPGLGSTVNFYIVLKNLILDSTSYSPSTAFTLVDWSVSQGTQLTNVLFKMPTSSQHTGVSTPEGGSGTYMGNLDFEGGAIGINMNNQQYNVKDCTFTDTTTGIYISHGFDIVFQGMEFTNCEVGINATDGGEGNVGSFTLIDSTAQSVDTVIVTKSQNVATGGTTADDSVVIDNLQTKNVGSTVVAGGVTLLKGSVPKTWVYGNAYLQGGPVNGIHDAGTTYQTSRSEVLLSDGKFFTMAPPTYQQYSVDQVVNIKTVKGFPVHGDGQTVSYQSSARQWVLLISLLRMIRTISISSLHAMQGVRLRSSRQAPISCPTLSTSHQDLVSSEKHSQLSVL